MNKRCERFSVAYRAGVLPASRKDIIATDAPIGQKAMQTLQRLSPTSAIQWTESPSLSHLLAKHLTQRNVAPAAVCSFAHREPSTSTFHAYLGASETQHSSYFDLASISKVLTALVAMSLIDQQAVSLNTQLAEVLPFTRGLAGARCELGHMLMHRSGLPSWGAVFREFPWEPTPTLKAPELTNPNGWGTAETMLSRAASRLETLQIGEHAPSVYSDLGYMLVGAMLAHSSGRPLDVLWHELTGIRSGRMLRNEEPDFMQSVLPTEHVPARGGDIRGIVHDENAWALESRGVISGHAGAFSTAKELLSLGISLLDVLIGQAHMFHEATLRFMIQPRSHGSHRLGFDGKSPQSSSAGRYMSPVTFGHLGFTGTSLWIDPEAQVVVVLLTNRTYPTRENTRIREARADFHDALFELFKNHF